MHFCKLNHFAYYCKRCKKGKEAASRWSSQERGEEGWKEKTRKMLPRTALLLPSNSKPKLLLFQRAGWACVALNHGPELGTLQRGGETTCGIRELCLGVAAPSISLTVGGKRKPAGCIRVNWKWFKSRYLGKMNLCLFGGMFVSEGGQFSFPHWWQWVERGWNLAWWMRTLRTETCKWSIATIFGDSSSERTRAPWHLLFPALTGGWFVSVLPLPSAAPQPVVMGRWRYFGMKYWGVLPSPSPCLADDNLSTVRLWHWVNFKLRFESRLVHSLHSKTANPCF